jgi:hypothetical protein
MLGSSGVTRNGVAFLLSWVALVACGQQGKKPDPLTCAGRCVPTTPGTVGHVGQPPPNGGAGGESGGDDSPVRLEGEVRILNDIVALAASTFTDTAAIVVEGDPTAVLGQWNGTDPFSISGVRRASAVWAQVTPTGGDALRTLAPIDTSRANSSGVVSTVLTVVRASELDAAYGVLSMPLARDSSKAQAILAVLDGGRPAAGIRVLVPGAEAVVYAENGTFSDDATSTDTSGLVLVANIPSVPWPGATVNVTLTGSTTTSRWDVKVVTDGVTLAGVGN